jgi:integrase
VDLPSSGHIIVIGIDRELPFACLLGLGGGVGLLIERGAHAKEIAERLGHSTVRLTLDRYAHLLPSLDERLREGLEETYQRAAAAGNVAQVWTKRGPRLLREIGTGP